MFIRHGLITLDEHSYIDFDKEVGNFFLSYYQRDIKLKIIVTTNLEFTKCEEMFCDPINTASIIDRLAQKATVINIKGDLYIIKDTKE